ncbi:ribonuclease H-like domain-containing protein [Rhizophagus clarus]|uniref:Ribonuclease H-like domain-containing protein n=1 Tax=Rhizophagus clarus TaxID=94130 RepID=A0A8H3QRK5_9GLOM|nr:ribonuclease H-like domain-containing protein [Rhizophagus clarus]
MIATYTAHGKTVEQDNTYATSITFFQHYIPVSINPAHNSHTSITPNSSHHAIYPCPGCHIREPNYRLGYKYTCIRSVRTFSCNIIKATPYNHDWVRKFDATFLPKTSLLLNKPLHLIRLTSYNDYLNLFSSTLTLHNTKQFKNSLITFNSYRSFNFFTDGSLSHIGTPECRYRFDWIQVAPNTPRLQFQGCSYFSPSSTRAEIFSILTVLLSVSSNSSQQLKINNYDLWYTIRELVFQKHLLVTFVKVKAYNGIVENDIADNLAKAAALGNDPILINPRFITSQLATIIWNGMAPITSNVRKFCNIPTAAAEFTRLMNSSLYAPITNSILANLIDWDLTSKWIRHNPLDSPTRENYRLFKHIKLNQPLFNYLLWTNLYSTIFITTFGLSTLKTFTTLKSPSSTSLKETKNLTVQIFAPTKGVRPMLTSAHTILLSLF